MALYARASNAVPRKGGKACEACGHAPPARVHRHISDGVTVAVVAHATNRSRFDAYYAQRAGRPDLADKMLCAPCYLGAIRAAQ